MKCNMGKTDRIMRVVMGVAILAAGFYFQSWWGMAGGVPLLTAALGFCPVYVPLGISTCGK
jgi:hypothetical protein